MDSSVRSNNEYENAVEAELQSVQRVNSVLNGLLESLSSAKSDTACVSEVVEQAMALLDTWTRVLNRTEYTQRLILHPAWGGSSKDIADAEDEALNKRRVREEREMEEARKRELIAEEKRSAEERAHIDISSGNSSRATDRGRARGTSRGSTRASSVSTSARDKPQPAAARAAISHYGRVRGKNPSRGTKER